MDFVSKRPQAKDLRAMFFKRKPANNYKRLIIVLAKNMRVRYNEKNY